MPKSPPVFRQKERRREKEQLRGNCGERGYDAHWHRISKAHRQQYPVCQVCNNATADDVDHIVPFSGLNDPLRTDRQNLQSICRKCHNSKTFNQ